LRSSSSCFESALAAAAAAVDVAAGTALPWWPGGMTLTWLRLSVDGMPEFTMPWEVGYAG